MAKKTIATNLHERKVNLILHQRRSSRHAGPTIYLRTPSNPLTCNRLAFHLLYDRFLLLIHFLINGPAVVVLLRVWREIISARFFPVRLAPFVDCLGEQTKKDLVGSGVLPVGEKLARWRNKSVRLRGSQPQNSFKERSTHLRFGGKCIIV